MDISMIQRFKQSSQGKFGDKDMLAIAYDFPYFEPKLVICSDDITYHNFSKFGNYDVVYKFTDRNFILIILPMRYITKVDLNNILHKINEVIDSNFLQDVISRGY